MESAGMSSVRRMIECGETILAVQDTTSLNYNSINFARGIFRKMLANG